MEHVAARGPAAQPPVLTARALGGTGASVFPIALDGSIFGWAAGIEHTVEVLDAFLAHGGHLVSTADHYAGGRSEVMIGTWLARSRARDDVLIATKVGRHPDHPGLGAASLAGAVDASLERLGTDRIDLLSFDGDHPETPAEESLEAVGRLIEAGKVRHLGASGFAPGRMREFAAIARDGGFPSIQVALPEYNLLERGPERELLPATRDLGIGVLARRPLADGYLTGNYRTRDTLPDSVMFAGAFRHIGRGGNRVLAALEPIAAEHGTTLEAVALAWVLGRPGITAAVARARDAAQIEQVFAAARVQLTRQQVAALDAASG